MLKDSHRLVEGMLPDTHPDVQFFDGLDLLRLSELGAGLHFPELADFALNTLVVQNELVARITCLGRIRAAYSHSPNFYRFCKYFVGEALVRH